MWCRCMALVSPVSLHGPQCHRCPCHCMAPGVWHGVTVTAWSLGYGTVSLSLYAPMPVSQVLPSLHGPWSVAQCHCHCTAPRASHSVTVAAQSHSCHTVLLRSPAVLHGVTVAPWGVTWCHCHRAVHRVSLSLRGHRVPHSVTAAPVGCHTESTVNAWCMGCHIVLCHCMAHGVSPSVTVTAVPQCITQCRCHCMAHGVSPSVTVTAWPGMSHTITAQDAPRCHPLHIPWAVTQCCCAPPQLHRTLSPPAVGHPGDSTAGPSSPSPRYSLPHVPLGGHVPEPVPSAHPAPRLDLAARRAAISHHSPAGPISRPLIK